MFSDLLLMTLVPVCPCMQLMDMKMTVDGLEKERDFYFAKLRDIELICQEHEDENNTVISKIRDILYATEVNKITSHIYKAHAHKQFYSFVVLYLQLQMCSVTVLLKYMSHASTIRQCCM